MRTERSFAIPMAVGATLLLAVILGILGGVPLVECPRCMEWYPKNSPLPTSGFFAPCPWCRGDRTVYCLQAIRHRLKPATN